MNFAPGQALLHATHGRVTYVGPSKRDNASVVVEADSGPQVVPVASLHPCIGDIWAVFDEVGNKIVGVCRAPDQAARMAKEKGPQMRVIAFRQLLPPK